MRRMKSLYSFELYGALTCFNFYSYLMHFHFFFCFFSWYSYSNYESCNRIKICAIIAWIKKYKSITKKKKKNHDKTLSLEKPKLNSIDGLISKALINSNISHNEFVFINNVPKKFEDIKEEVKNSNNK